MALLDLVIEPDPRYGTLSDRLRQKCERIETIDASIRKLAEDMYETMLHEHGVGLAAPQVGVRKRLLTIYLPEGYTGEGEPEVSLVLVNPEIVKAGGREYGLEGCLSFPDLVGEVPRYASVQVKALGIDGKPLRIKTRGTLARVLQHEIDHLDGVLYFDRMDDWSTLGYLPDRDDDEDAEPTDPAQAGELADARRS